GEQIMFNVFEAMKRHDEEEPRCHQVEVIEEVVEDVFAEETPSPPLERIMVNSIEELEEQEDHEIENCLQHLESNRVDESPKVEEL
ncbi:hypothetical protein A2U01_0085381, partial [Trifolium medium]|nr:hypothetical protein [Trifolium medium]